MSKGKSLGHCKTCESEIVETVNDSVFGDGECNECEYQRYRSQPDLLEALDYLLDQSLDQDLAYGIKFTEGEQQARKMALKAFAKADGKKS